MREAVNLLLTENEKTYIIAQKVGYVDPNYFSYVFKKEFGMSPSKYKQNRPAGSRWAWEASVRGRVVGIYEKTIENYFREIIFPASGIQKAAVDPDDDLRFIYDRLDDLYGNAGRIAV